MHLFYAPDIATPHYTLSEEEAKHSIRVLRLTVGDTVYLIDGVGGFYTARIADISSKSCTVAVTNVQKEYGKRDYGLHIAIAPTKNIDRFEWFLEKATEMGIDEITPLLCEHSERKILKPERLEKIIESAMKQSLKAYKPKLNKLQTFSDFVRQNHQAGCFIAHCYDGQKQLLKNVVQPTAGTLVAIGPEGDFSQQEVALAKQHSYQEVSLGNSRLRTETAGVVACCTVWLASQKEENKAS